MPTTIERPFIFDVTDPSNASALWSPAAGPTSDMGVYRFSKTGTPGPMAGRGIQYWKINIPKNLAGTPAWNVVLHHMNASGDQGAVLFRAEALVLATGDTPGGFTTLVANQLIGVDVSGDFNITALSSSNFDSTLALTAGDLLRLRLMRMPVAASGDSLIGHWDLVYPPVLRVDVT